MAQKVGAIVKDYHKTTGKPILKILVKNPQGEIVAASVGRRKIHMANGFPYLRCSNMLHPGSKLRPYTEFAVHSQPRGIFLKAECRKCHNKRKHQTPYVPAHKIRPFLLELIDLCGGKRPAARAIGLPVSCLYRWLGTKGSMRHKNATLILSTLSKVRRS